MTSARGWALRWLSQRNLSAAELEQRLLAKGFDPDEVKTVIDDLLEHGWINEHAVYDAVIRQGLAHHAGPRKIAARLQRRRLDQEWVARFRQTESREVDWQEIAEALLRRYDKDDPRERARLLRRLVREGFPRAVIARISESWDDAQATADHWEND
ncbi:hypothetical protein TPY_1655 [Sulfobacillus acidophilus TPY]|uniref:Regulatory protein RecX n=1 Tax=Sulfobacillus acidophilus (strain ATCC 700253 / DSM 10332 / NAL) TaxID=679936 RepID=G8U0P5_SULAD|nr:hypothetical protein TPY_1655 [Sulfobacillus acidophilus TPY]AEW05348.1 Regulatory protein recX [Sulfobacillus acidophilus DSM 10332]